MIFLIIGSFIYVSFFMVLPGIGAITLRNKWKRFRELVFKYSSIPTLEYNNLEKGELFSFQGKLESFKDDDIIWLKGEALSICINLNKQNIYTLSRRKDEVLKARWDNITSLVEGTLFFVFGHLEFNNGIPYLTGSENEDLLVLIGSEEDVIFESLIKKGRNKNEMWNNSTPYSYITGVLILIILSYFSYTTSSNKTSAYFLLLAAGTPFYFIVPPGLFFYFKYRRIWDQSIRWSVLKDLKRLKGYTKSSKLMKIKSKSRERLSLLYYLLGYITNLSIAGIIIFKLFQIIIYN